MFTCCENELEISANDLHTRDQVPVALTINLKWQLREPLKLVTHGEIARTTDSASARAPQAQVETAKVGHADSNKAKAQGVPSTSHGSKPSRAPLKSHGSKPSNAPLKPDGPKPSRAPLKSHGSKPSPAPLKSQGSKPSPAPLKPTLKPVLRKEMRNNVRAK